MKLTYYAKKIAEGVYQVTGLSPDTSVTAAALEAADVTYNTDIPVVGSGLQEPYGQPDMLILVADEEGVLHLQEKTVEVKLIETKSVVSDKLSAYTSELIYGVCDEEKQRSLSLLYNNMSTVDKSKAKLYFTWHKDMLAKHNQIKQLIADATTQVELEAIEASFETEYEELMASVPYDSLDLSAYIH